LPWTEAGEIPQTPHSRAGFRNPVICDCFTADIDRSGGGEAIMARVRELLPDMEPESVLRLPAGALRAAGLSMRKVEYAEGLAQAMMEMRFDPTGLAAMDDQAVIDAITALRGFGAWSAEIYLMFSLQRSDIFPAGDLALRIALQKLKGIAEPLNEKQARAIVADWSPYRSAGSLFLWHYYRGAPT
jgi:DNA-3-methyladenine glycosylase II